jgi:hypothetical protein
MSFAYEEGRLQIAGKLVAFAIPFALVGALAACDRQARLSDAAVSARAAYASSSPPTAGASSIAPVPASGAATAADVEGALEILPNFD